MSVTMDVVYSTLQKLHAAICSPAEEEKFAACKFCRVHFTQSMVLDIAEEGFRPNKEAVASEGK